MCNIRKEEKSSKVIAPHTHAFCVCESGTRSDEGRKEEEELKR